jgi:hypothetical protein
MINLSRARKTLPLATGAFAAVLCAIGITFSARGKAPGLIVAADSLGFGEIIETNNFVWPVKLYNNTDDTLVIQGFVISCACISIIPEELSIGPKSFSTCYAHMDLTSLSLCGDAAKTQKRYVKVNVEPIVRRIPLPSSPSPSSRPSPFTITGTVIPVLQFEARTIGLGRIQEGQAILKAVKVKSDFSLDNLDARCEAKGWSCSVSSSGASDFLLTVACNDYIPPGPLGLKITLQPTSKQVSSSVRYEIPVNGYVVSEFTASPPALMLGRRTLETKHHESVVLSAPDGKPFDIVTIASDSPDTVIQPNDTSGPNQKRFEIEQLASLPGRQMRTVRFHLLRHDKVQRTLVLPIEYGLPQKFCHTAPEV